jgi:hypothetical protein
LNTLERPPNLNEKRVSASPSSPMTLVRAIQLAIWDRATKIASFQSTLLLMEIAKEAVGILRTNIFIQFHCK